MTSGWRWRTRGGDRDELAKKVGSAKQDRLRGFGLRLYPYPSTLTWLTEAGALLEIARGCGDAMRLHLRKLQRRGVQ